MPNSDRIDHEYPMAAELHVVVRIRREVPVARQTRTLMTKLKRSLDSWAAAQPEPLRCESATDG